MHALELRIPPLMLVLAFASAMAVVAYAVPAAVAVPWRVALAVALVLAGAAVALAGVVAFRKHRTTVNPFTPEQSSSLVSTGIYRFSRNPMYLGFLLALAGISVFLANWASALLIPVFVAYMNRVQIQPEERALKQRFGQEFATYSATVRRWL
ncbi:MAG: isoprenylcysteine carboxylmethyltransferase family protein [Comamonadaceae bacterium]|jgi:protein-S-isoprenylcysteine O-methyltransferase Ste14|nr:isoprenylcysteine carboxylmethyltransferase family protein [Comamonadaceae bacterium]